MKEEGELRWVDSPDCELLSFYKREFTPPPPTFEDLALLRY